MNYITFAIYTLIVLLLLGFISVFLVHIRDFQQYSRYIAPVTRVYLFIFVVIAMLGGYFVLTGSIFPESSSQVQRINL